MTRLAALFAVLFTAVSMFATPDVLSSSSQQTPGGSRKTEPVARQAITGAWDAVITNAANIDVPFGLAIQRTGKGLQASIVNGTERLPFTSAKFEGDDLKLGLEQYDGTLTVRLVNGELSGTWSRQTREGVRRYPFRASRQKAPSKVKADWSGPSLSGDWVFTFEGPPDSSDRVAPAKFVQNSARREGGSAVAKVEGTIAPVSGDYGLLAGKVTVENGTVPVFRLSRFDGIHIVLVTGEFQSDGSIKGKLNKQAFTAVRKTDQSTAGTSGDAGPTAEGITSVKNPNEVFRFSGRDYKTGAVVTQEDPRFKGKPYIVDIFGTWCPNCHDEAPVLKELYSRYREQGLEIVGLAYEYVDDAQRNGRLIEIYRKKYNLDFPMLLVGTTDDGQIAKTLPQLQGFGAYPTTIFVGADGKVKKIHAGFSGPATGEQFTEVKKRFEENVKELLQK